MTTAILRGRYIGFRMEGFGTMIGLRDLRSGPGPDHQRPGQLFSGSAELCAERAHFFREGAVEMLLSFIADDGILNALLHARIDSETTGTEIAGDHVMRRFQKSGAGPC